MEATRAALERAARIQPQVNAFVRLTEGETSDDDVYVSAAQVKRCELVSGDRIAGPVRAPRRSERLTAIRVRPSRAKISPRGICCSSISGRRLAVLASSPLASNTDQYEVKPTSTANSTAARP